MNKQNRDKTIKTHYFTFSESNGGSSLGLSTKFIGNGDDITGTDGIYLNQEFTLNSYGNAATFNLCGDPLTPELLRKLANELEIARNSCVGFTEKSS